MKSDTMQVLILAGVMVVAIVLGVISWSMIPDSRQGNTDSAEPQSGGDSTPSPSAGDPTSGTVTPSPGADEPSYPDNDPGYDDTGQMYEGLMPSSIVKWDSKLGSELSPNGTAVWTELITSTISANIGYNRLSWDNVFYDNQFGGGNVKLQVTWAFTDGDGADYQRNRDGIGYHGTWAPTSTTWVVTSPVWNKRWTLGVTHAYTSDFQQNGATADTYGLHYSTYE